MFAPYIRHLRLAHYASSGSCHPTRTSLVFGVLFRSSGSLLFFQVRTHRARLILSVEAPLLLYRDVTRFSIHEFHSFCIALSNSFLSWGPRLRNDTSTLCCLALGVTSKQSSKTSQGHSGSDVLSVAKTSIETSNTCSARGVLRLALGAACCAVTCSSSSFSGTCVFTARSFASACCSIMGMSVFSALSAGSVLTASGKRLESFGSMRGWSIGGSTATGSRSGEWVHIHIVQLH